MAHRSGHRMAEHFGLMLSRFLLISFHIEPALKKLDKIWQIKRLGLLRA